MISLFVGPIAGFLMDKYGFESALKTAMLFIAVSQIIMLLSVAFKSFHIMILGRLIVGAGFDVMSMSKSLVLNRWFFDTEMSFASNFGLAISRSFVFLSGIVTPRVAQNYGVAEAFTIGFGLILVSLIASFFVTNLHQKVKIYTRLPEV